IWSVLLVALAIVLVIGIRVLRRRWRPVRSGLGELMQNLERLETAVGDLQDAVDSDSSRSAAVFADRGELAIVTAMNRLERIRRRQARRDARIARGRLITLSR
ncbi:hypothetical protein ACC691_37830, partial [Rhizobium johnstonii]|uniref:hypothetical protein n=1 Tax=Rhizobium johnstonii TaxID=3019933 RepID=UPI003F9A02BA